MYYFLCVAIVNGRKDLFDDICSILLAKVLLLSYSLEQLASVAQPNSHKYKQGKQRRQGLTKSNGLKQGNSVSVPTIYD